MKNLITINQLDKKEVIEIIELAKKIEVNPNSFSKELENKILATIFFQPSTRTRISSSLAMHKLGGKVIELYETKMEDGMSESESFEDTIRVVGDYADIICLRHNSEDAPYIAEGITKTKLINCGNGKDQHPTQTLIDLYTIFEEFGRLNDLKMAIVGGLKNSRSAHSLLIALSLFENNRVKLIYPKNLGLPKKYFELVNNKLDIIESNFFDIGDEDVIYMAGLTGQEADKSTREEYELNLDDLKSLKKKPIILSPMPIIDEIDRKIDNLENARYFKQSKNGLYVRMALFIKMFRS